MARNQTGTIEGDETPGSVFMRHSPHDFLALTDDIVKQFSTKHDWHLAPSHADRSGRGQL